MNIKVERYWSDKDATLGKLYLDKKFLCYTLEDEYRKEKKLIEINGEQTIEDVFKEIKTKLNSREPDINGIL